MNTLIGKLFENFKSAKHPNGTYVSAQLSPISSEDLHRWVTDNKIGNLVAPEEYHATITYSRKGIPEVDSHDFKLPLKAEIVGWHVFPTKAGSNCLVCDIESAVLTKLHKDIKDKYGATHDFDSYKPHITVSYDYDKDTPPSTFPKMSVTFNKINIEPLDVDKEMKTDE